jgi:hypothetical protein
MTSPRRPPSLHSPQCCPDLSADAKITVDKVDGAKRPPNNRLERTAPARWSAAAQPGVGQTPRQPIGGAYEFTRDEHRSGNG